MQIWERDIPFCWKFPIFQIENNIANWIFSSLFIDSLDVEKFFFNTLHHVSEYQFESQQFFFCDKKKKNIYWIFCQTQSKQLPLWFFFWKNLIFFHWKQVCTSIFNVANTIQLNEGSENCKSHKTIISTEIISFAFILYFFLCKENILKILSRTKRMIVKQVKENFQRKTLQIFLWWKQLICKNQLFKMKCTVNNERKSKTVFQIKNWCKKKTIKIRGGTVKERNDSTPLCKVYYEMPLRKSALVRESSEE